MTAQYARPELVATCWTSAGNVGPLDVPEESPFDVIERVRAIAATGWSGFGLAQDDLAVVKKTIGFAALREEARSLGLTHIEVEVVGSWWREESLWRPTWELLLEAAEVLGATFIKVGSAFGEPVTDHDFLVEPLRRLGDEAAAIGTKVALEPLPFALIGSMPQGARLIRDVGHPAVGLIVDYWHIFRAGTSLQQLVETVPRSAVFGVELSDAAAEPVGDLFEDTRDRRALVGEGAQDVAGFIRAMREIGFDGPWGVEVISHEHRARALTDALRVSFDSAFALVAAERS